MQILLLGDIHANYRALEAILDRYSEADEIWCLGDIVEYGPSPSLCIERVRECCTHVVQGNHDVSYALAAQGGQESPWVGCDRRPIQSEDIAYLLQLPQFVIAHADGISYYLAHGSPQNPLSGRISPSMSDDELRQAFQFAGTDVIMGGHTHMAMVGTVDGHRAVNVGTVGQSRDGNPRAQCMLIEDGILRFERVDYDLDALADDYARSSLPESIRCPWIDYSRRGIVDVHGLQIGPFSRSG